MYTVTQPLCIRVYFAYKITVSVTEYEVLFMVNVGARFSYENMVNMHGERLVLLGSFVFLLNMATAKDTL